MSDGLTRLSLGDVPEKRMMSSKDLIDRYFSLFLELFSVTNQGVFLKGNVLLNKVLPKEARSTLDLDVSCYSEDIYYSTIVPILRRFGDAIISEGFATEYRVNDISLERSGGIRFTQGTQGASISVDISLNSAAEYTTARYTLGEESIIGSSVNKILADKCGTTLSNRRLRRVKDFYDIYIILNSGLKYDPERILLLMLDTFGEEGTRALFRNIPFSEEDMQHLTHAWERLDLKSVFYNRPINKPLLSEVLRRVAGLYNIVLSMLQRRE